MKKSNLLKSATGILLFSSMLGSVHADGISDPSTHAVDLAFAAQGKVSIEIKPKTDLLAGKFSNDADFGTVTFKSASPGTIAYRWTPGSYKSQKDKRTVTFSGENDADNVVRMKFSNVTSVSKDVGEDGWNISPANTKELSVGILHDTDSSWSLKPDTYKVSIDAVMWAS